jgi:hypothetical protein
MRIFQSVELKLRNLRYNLTVRKGYCCQTTALRRRDELPYLLNRLGLTGEGVEIGVFKGDYAEEVLNTWKGRRYYLVDPWIPYEDEPEQGVVPREPAAYNQLFETTKARMARFGDRAVLLRMTSLEAAPRFADGSLDFVYIDGLHTYEAVRDDVRAWFPKIKPGGLLAGHDYIDGPGPHVPFGVKSAVNEFAAERGLKVGVTQRDQPSWFIFVPGT